MLSKLWFSIMTITTCLIGVAVPPEEAATGNPPARVWSASKERTREQERALCHVNLVRGFLGADYIG